MASTSSYFWLKILLISLILHQFDPISGEEYKFCVDSLSYAFSTDACPGGVLLKKPVKITEPCHCFGGDLKIYNRCGSGAYVSKYATPDGCSKFTKFDAEVMLLLPTDLKPTNRTELELCYGMPSYCVELKENMVMSTPEKLLKLSSKIDKSTKQKIPVQVTESPETFVTEKTEESSSFSSSTSDEDYSDEDEPTTTKEPSINDLASNSSGFKLDPSNNIPLDDKSKNLNIQQGKSINPLLNPIPDLSNNKNLRNLDLEEDENTRLTRQKLDWKKEDEDDDSWEDNEDNETGGDEDDSDIYIDNVSLLRHVMGVKEGLIPNPPPNTKTFKMIKESIRVAQKLIPNNIIKDVNLNEAYLAFRHLFENIDEDMKIDRHLNIEDFNSIMLALDTCFNTASTLAFKTNRHSGQIQNFYKMQSSGTTKAHPNIPNDRAHKPDNEDYIIGIIWKVIDIVHSACFNEFRLNNPSTQFNYLVSIENVFYRPQVQKRWYQPQLLDKETEKKLNLIMHPNMKVFMENLDTIDAAIHSISGFQYFLRKPIDKNTAVNSNGPSSSQDLKRRKRQPKKSQLNAIKKSRKHKKIHKQKRKGDTRRKRENLKNIIVDPTDYEIWGGKAFCLQKINPKLPASSTNVLPRVRDLCKNIQQGAHKI